MTHRSRRLPIGAEPLGDGQGVHFRVWAPRRSQVAVVLEGEGPGSVTALAREQGGYFSGVVVDARAGSRYRFRLDDDGTLYPDPASRFQPDGPHGSSMVVDPGAYRWKDGEWRGLPLQGRVIYEMHVGTFTSAGTWRAASDVLPTLAQMGITIVEMMPVSEFPGRFGWGYDGVDLFAPTRLYGEPDDLRAFVDRAHALGIAVILDVVYNHLGPDGNYLKAFSEDYFTDRYENEWGEPLNFDGPNATGVREFFVENAGYWVDEFHFDGLRLDATQSVHDSSADHVLGAIARRARAAAKGRTVLVVAENEPQDTRLFRPVDEGGFGMDGAWNDDFHHAARVAVTGRSEGYYSDYTGLAQELVSAAKYGYLFQGQYYTWQKKRRGTPTRGIAPGAFVVYLQNHDQIANSARGERLHQLTSPGRYRALTALMLLAPQTPMLFQGQEYGAPNPFLYFADHKPELALPVRRGRAHFLRQFPSLAQPEMQETLPDPADPMTFMRCKLEPSDRAEHPDMVALHTDLLAIRSRDPVVRLQGALGFDGAVLGERTFVLRYFGEAGQDRVLLVNLGHDLRFTPSPEPLLAPPAACGWTVHWSSEDPKYGGHGTAPIETREGWRLPGEAAVLLIPSLQDDREPPAGN